MGARRRLAGGGGRGDDDGGRHADTAEEAATSASGATRKRCAGMMLPALLSLLRTAALAAGGRRRLASGGARGARVHSLVAEGERHGGEREEEKEGVCADASSCVVGRRFVFAVASCLSLGDFFFGSTRPAFCHNRHGRSQLRLPPMVIVISQSWGERPPLSQPVTAAHASHGRYSRSQPPRLVTALL